MGKLNIWTSGLCSMASLVEFFGLSNIGLGIILAGLAIINLVIGVVMS